MPRTINSASCGKTGSVLSQQLDATACQLSRELPGAKVNTDVWGEVSFEFETFTNSGETILHGSIAIDLDDQYRIWLHYEGPQSAPLADFKARAHVAERTRFRTKMPTGVEYPPALAAVRQLVRRVNAQRARKLSRLVDEISESTRELTCL